MAIDIHVQEEQVTVALDEATKVEYVEVEVEVKVDPVLQSKTATENGVVVPDSGFDGLSKVTVNVPSKEPVLQEKTATQNGEVTPDSGYDGLSKVNVNVPDKAPKLQDKTITENGTYSADSGFDGLGSVIVEVAGSGGGGSGGGYNAHYYESFVVNMNDPIFTVSYTID